MLPAQTTIAIPLISAKIRTSQASCCQAHFKVFWFQVWNDRMQHKVLSNLPFFFMLFFFDEDVPKFDDLNLSDEAFTVT